MGTKTEIADYMRTSTHHQKMDLQKAAVADYLEKNDMKSKHFEDHGYTGTNMCRPAFEELNDLVESSKIKTVIVWKLDRLGRSAVDLLHTLERWNELGVKIVSITESIDFSTASGRFFIMALSAVTQYETELRRERSLAGIEAYRSSGKKWPGGRKKGCCPVLTKDMKKSIKALHKGGVNVNQISKQLGISRPTVYRGLEAKC